MCLTRTHTTESPALLTVTQDGGPCRQTTQPQEGTAGTPSDLLKLRTLLVGLPKTKCHVVTKKLDKGAEGPCKGSTEAVSPWTRLMSQLWVP